MAIFSLGNPTITTRIQTNSRSVHACVPPNVNNARECSYPSFSFASNPRKRQQLLKASAPATQTAASSSTWCWEHAVIAACVAQLAVAPIATAESVTVAVPLSRNPEVRKVQQALVETWAYVNKYFVDPKLNGLDWDALLQGTLKRTVKAHDRQEALEEVSLMVKALDDPYTKILDPSQTEKYSAQKEGQVLSNGLVAARLPDGRVQVVYVLEGSPADRAGVKVGDQLSDIQGQDVARLDPSLDLTTLLTKEIDVRLVKSSSGVKAPTDSANATQIHLQPAYVNINPVQFSLLESPGKEPVGYVHLTSFTTTATQQVQRAVEELKAKGAKAFVLDLRDNPGGLVQAGLDMAHIFLRNGDVFCFVTDRDGFEQMAVIRDGQHILDGPLVLLVNHNTTSTSELLAGALHDNLPALLVGETTFGKGRTQLAVDLSDGSTLLVSTLLYTTPAGTVVDHVGLQPDVFCRPDSMEMQYYTPGQVEGGSLLDDPCIAVAYGQALTGGRPQKV